MKKTVRITRTFTTTVEVNEENPSDEFIKRVALKKLEERMRFLSKDNVSFDDLKNTEERIEIEGSGTLFEFP